MSDLQSLFAAFAVAWIVLGAYVLFIVRRQTQLRREVEELRMEIEERKEAGGTTG